MNKLEIPPSKCPACNESWHQCQCSPENPPRQKITSCIPNPACNECGGAHEPSGARIDCIEHWKRLAVASIDLVEWARALLCNATPNSKFLDEVQQREYARNFGKWRAESHALPLLAHDWGCSKQIYDWLSAGKYRHVMHHHSGLFRASDESCNRYVDAQTLPGLCDALLDWPEKGAEPEGWVVNPEWVRLGESRHFLNLSGGA